MKPQFLFLTVLIFAGCNSISNSKLAGTWQAVSMKINDESVEVDLSDVQLSFEKNGGYNYSSTLNYRESGFYQVDKNFLYTIDTLNQGSSEKAVEIVEFSADKILIKMQEKGEKRLIQFQRK